MNTQALPKVLCVDDEVRVLEGLALHLRRGYTVHSATGGEEALNTLKEVGGFAVVISDMRMPGMNGAKLLHQVMRLYPDTVRILLTGEPGPDAAAAAVNDGQIFRFLTKPCPPEQLHAALEAAVAQHRLIVAERELLQETLIGCIQSLVDVLAITNPVAFGRAHRVKRLAVDLAERFGMKSLWQLEAAAMLSHIGYVSLPPDLAEKLHHGQRLSPEEQVLTDGVPQVASRLLEHIPRIDPVLEILALLGKPAEGRRSMGGGTAEAGANILSLVLAYEALLANGQSTEVAIQVLRSRDGLYDDALLCGLTEHLGAGGDAGEVHEIPLRLVRPGMTLLDDLYNRRGILLAPKGYEISESFLARLQNLGSELLARKVQMLVNP